MATLTLILGRDGLGSDGSEDAFESWVAFVCEHIDELCGFTVDVDTRNQRDGGQDDCIVGGSDDERKAIFEAKEAMWDRWCAEGQLPAQYA